MILKTLALVPLLLVSGCGGKVDTFRDALARDDFAGASRLASAPACARSDVVGKGESACLTAIARAFGSKHEFNLSNPDQADAAAVAMVLVRERRGDFVPGPETWMLAMKASTGPGADALRLAVAARMAEIAPRLGKRVDDDAEAARLVHEIGTAIPGACASYALLGDGIDVSTLADQDSPDHSPCVQKDLERKDAPGPTYGFGVWRAIAGAVALWKDEARALRAGEGESRGAAKAAIAAKLATIEAATQKIELKTVDVPHNAWAH